MVGDGASRGSGFYLGTLLIIFKLGDLCLVSAPGLKREMLGRCRRGEAELGLSQVEVASLASSPRPPSGNVE